MKSCSVHKDGSLKVQRRGCALPGDWNKELHSHGESGLKLRGSCALRVKERSYALSRMWM